MNIRILDANAPKKHIGGEPPQGNAGKFPHNAEEDFRARADPPHENEKEKPLELAHY